MATTKKKKKPKRKKKGILKLAGSIPVKGLWVKFTAADHIKVDVSEKAQVKVWYIPENAFKRLLEKVEANVVAIHLRIHRLVRKSKNRGIIASLKYPETNLWHFWSALRLQPNGEKSKFISIGPTKVFFGKGELLTNGLANVFYIRDVDGVLLAVTAVWETDAWRLGASPVSTSIALDPGVQIVSL